MKEETGGVVLVNKFKDILDSKGMNPHKFSQKVGLTYRVVLKLYNSETVPGTTPISTLYTISRGLGLKVDDLYVAQENNRH